MEAISKGKRFRVVRDFSTTALTHWKAPMTDGLACTLREGTILVVASDSPTSRIAITCIPEDQEAFIAQQIHEDIRRDPKFAGISFVIEKSEIGTTITPV